MTTQHTYTKGDRVRLICVCPGGQVGDEGQVTALHTSPQAVETLTILIDGDPARVRGITVFVHEVELVTSTSSEHAEQ